MRNDGRDVLCTLAPAAVLAEFLAVVGGQHDQRAVVEPRLLQPEEKAVQVVAQLLQLADARLGVEQAVVYLSCAGDVCGGVGHVC